MTRETQQLALKVTMPAELLHCSACRHPLKPPVYMSDASHLVCSTCSGVHGDPSTPSDTPTAPTSASSAAANPARA